MPPGVRWSPAEKIGFRENDEDRFVLLNSLQIQDNLLTVISLRD